MLFNQEIGLTIIEIVYLFCNCNMFLCVILTLPNSTKAQKNKNLKLVKIK